MRETPEMLNKLVNEAVEKIRMLNEYLAGVTQGDDLEFCDHACERAEHYVKSVMQWWTLDEGRGWVD